MQLPPSREQHSRTRWPDARSLEKMHCDTKQIEGHADNAGAALPGSLVVTYTQTDSGVGASRLAWPKMFETAQ